MEQQELPRWSPGTAIKYYWSVLLFFLFEDIKSELIVSIWKSSGFESLGFEWTLITGEFRTVDFLWTNFVYVRTGDFNLGGVWNAAILTTPPGSTRGLCEI